MKTIVGIFAHPDDEVFGPGGTLAILSKDANVYLICVTNGDAQGETPEKEKQLGEIRKKELKESGKILGVKDIIFLGYKDGSLCNNIYHEIAEKLQAHLEVLKPDTLVTFEPRGVSGHIDHIFVSMVTSFVFYKLAFIKTLLYYCITQEMHKYVKDYFIYVPPGYAKSEIGKIIPTATVLDRKIQAMHRHVSQIKDVNKLLEVEKIFPKEEHFLVVEK